MRNALRKESKKYEEGSGVERSSEPEGSTCYEVVMVY